MMAKPTGRTLNERWRIGAAHALYRENGTWYHLLKRFPGALCDAHGYVLFDSEQALRAHDGVLVGSEDRNWLNVPAGIATLPGYVKGSPPLSGA